MVLSQCIFINLLLLQHLLLSLSFCILINLIGLVILGNECCTSAIEEREREYLLSDVVKRQTNLVDEVHYCTIESPSEFSKE